MSATAPSVMSHTPVATKRLSPSRAPAPTRTTPAAITANPRPVSIRRSRQRGAIVALYLHHASPYACTAVLVRTRGYRRHGHQRGGHQGRESVTPRDGFSVASRGAGSAGR